MEQYDRKEKAIATFTVHVTAVEGATWQGVVEANGEWHHFQSEMQLLRWVMDYFPPLHPGNLPD